MPEPQDTIARVLKSHEAGHKLTERELLDAAKTLDTHPDKDSPGWTSARDRIEGQLESLGY